MPQPRKAREARAPQTFDDQPEEVRRLVEFIRKRKDSMEKLHKQYRDKWTAHDGLYNNYDELRKKWSSARAQESDRDTGRGVLLDANREWGGYLLIPYAFATVETVVPRIVMNRPKVIARPLDSAAVPHIKVNQDLVNQQQTDIDYELKLQPTVRRALKLGMGVQYMYWQHLERKVIRPVQGPDGKWSAVEQDVTIRRGPQVEDIDIYDWFWDDAAKSIETCEDILYRTWRPFSYVKKMVEKGPEEGGWLPVDLETVKGMGRQAARNELISGRLNVQGLSPSELQDQGVHEVWQYHRGERVVSILDDTFVVANDETPQHHREYPYQLYRPIMVEGQIPGKSVIEPIEHLIAELSTLRTQRRDAATIALNPPTFYTQGFLSRKNAKTGPGIWTPVQGDPREAIYQPPLKDIPASGYAEEDRLKQDIELTTGMSDQVRGGSMSAETATGAQLELQNANVRISLMARMMLLETIKPGLRQHQALNRQYLIDTEGTSQEVRIDDPAEAEGYRFADVTPEALMANVEFTPEEHSTEPENRVQRVNDALSLFQQMQGNEQVEPSKPLEFLLTAYGVPDPQSWIRQQNEVSPEAIAEAVRRQLISSGVPEEKADQQVLALVTAAQDVQTEITQATEGQNGAAPPQEA